MFQEGFLSLRYIDFLILWFLAAIQFGPNAWNCLFLAAFVGFKNALIAVLGIASVCIVYMAIIFVGQELLFSLANNLTLTIIQWCGLLWILYLGVKKLISGQWFDFARERKETTTPITLIQVFRESVIISLSNPKVIIFYYAIFSQFLLPSTATIQVYAYFLIALVVTIFVYIFYCLLGYFSGNFIRKKIKTIPTDYIAGFSFIFIAVLLFFDIIEGV